MTLIFSAGCSSKMGLDLTEGPETYDELKKDYKDLRAEYERKREFYTHVKNEVYPEVKRLVTENWDQYNKEEKEFWSNLDEEARSLDSDLVKYDKKLQKFDERMRSGSEKLEDLYERFQELKDRKEEISDTVDNILNSNKKL